MDFGTLLQTAKQNEGSKKDIRTYQTKFAPPKKQEKKDKVLSANIQKFLARKETEEKKKVHDANKKRDDLLALRSKDKKATRRVNVMLKRTKSANQSVIDDAVDNDNTAVTLVGPAQPDEDDYGYVSQEASAFYNKMMEKYNKMPEEQKFPNTKKRASSNLSSTKDRVKAALEKEKLEAMMPHRRKRKHKDEGEQDDHGDNDCDDDEVTSEEKSEPPRKVKPINKGPPPINFTDLLKLASQKQHEPIMIEVKPKDEGPLFTKKQKQELVKEQQRRGGEEKVKLSSDQINDIRKLPPSYLYKTKRQRDDREISRSEVHEQFEDSDDDFVTPNRIPKVSDHNRKDVPVCDNPRKLNGLISNSKGAQISKSQSSKSVAQQIDKSKTRPTNSQSSKSAQDSRLAGKSFTKPSLDTQPTKVNVEQPHTSRKSSTNANRPKINNPESTFKSKSQVPLYRQESSTSKMQPPSTLPRNHKAINKHKNVIEIQQRKSFPPDDRLPKQSPSKDMKPKQFPPPDVVRRKEPNIIRSKPQIANNRRIIDDDEEYDSEMDDFIDDGPEESNDYSNYIREIFGYDKRKYKKTEEDDVDNMESSFAQQMREDVRSTKLGIMEDLEDMKKEREEKRIKALKKKGRL